MDIHNAETILEATDEMTGVEIAIVTVLRDLEARMAAMSATRKLIEFGEELLEDDTLELTPTAHDNLARLIAAAKKEVA